jgi:hypothetical protein
VKQHDVDDAKANMACEQHACHRQAAGEAFLGSAEDDGDLVGTRKAEPPACESQNGDHDRKQRGIDEREPDQLGYVDLMPNTVRDAVAEGRVYDSSIDP